MTTRFPNGLTTAAKSAPMGEFILPDMTKASVFMEDFHTFNENDWTTIGNGNKFLGNGEGGVLIILNNAVVGEETFIQTMGAFYRPHFGDKLWFDCLFKVDNAIDSDIVVGIKSAAGSPLDPVDAMFFLKSDGVDTVDFFVRKGNVDTITTSVATLSPDVNVRLSFFYDGLDSIKIFVDGVHQDNSVTTNLPDNGVLAVYVGIKNGDGASKQMDIDYLMVAKER